MSNIVKEWSSFQKLIFNTYLEFPKHNLSISATAGSGKSTVLLELLKLKDTTKTCVFLTFSKALAEELKEKVPDGVLASTIHSLCLKSLFKHYSGCLKIDDGKAMKIAMKLGKSKFTDILPAQLGKYCFQLLQHVQSYRLNCCENMDQYEKINVMNGRELCASEKEHTLLIVDAIREYNKKKPSKTNKLLIDFTDMLEMMVTNNTIYPTRYDEVYIDEFQDLSALQMQVVDKITKRSGRQIMCGDEKQSLYMFIGADIARYKEIQNRPNTKILTLPITYRCSKAICKEASKIYDDIVPRDGAPEGAVYYDGSPFDAVSGDFVICRNNKPLIDLYFEMLTEGKKCFIRDKDLGKKLTKAVKSFGNIPIGLAMSKIDTGLDKVRAELKKRGIKRPSLHPRYITASELAEILKNILMRFETLADVQKLLTRMFVEDKKNPGVMLTTFHKSKGLECDNVYLYRLKSTFPSKYATTPQMMEQENNALFVGTTRGRLTLTYC